MPIQFDTDENEFHIKSRRLLGEAETPTMIRMLLDWGLVKTEKQALVVLIGVVVVVIGATWWVLGMRSTENRIVELPDGRVYKAEEYFRLKEAGRDPLREI